MENFRDERNTECVAPSTMFSPFAVETRLDIRLNDNSIFVESTFQSLEFSDCQGTEGDDMDQDGFVSFILKSREIVDICVVLAGG